MPTFELEDLPPLPVIDDDAMFTAELVACKIVEKNYLDDDGQKGRKTQFSFRILDAGENEDRILKGETPVKFTTHPDNRLKNWAQALENSGNEYPVGYRLNTDSLINKQCRIVVGYKQFDSDDGKKVDWNFVKDVLPARQPSGASSF